ncbi:taurine catabolism dioxygenase [Apiospora arundinis]
MSLSEHPHHVSHIVEELRRYGVLQISLKFLDNNSRYLRQLLLGFHQNHGHRLPIAHSATCGWFWDIRPSTATFQSAIYQARSETMDPFPWHTDCSYEEQPPRYFALQVIRPDRCGGGTFSLLDVRRLSRTLSTTTKAALRRPDYQITTPPEFIKDPMRQSLVGSILEAGESGLSDYALMRYRGDLVTPLSEEGARALKELKDILRNESLISTMALSLSSAKMAEGSILLVDNRRWLHSRTDIHDPMRHLRRVRWDAAPFHAST